MATFVVTLSSLDDWEKSFRTGGISKAELPEVKVLPLDFRNAAAALGATELKRESREAVSVVASAEVNGSRECIGNAMNLY